MVYVEGGSFKMGSNQFLDTKIYKIISKPAAAILMNHYPLSRIKYCFRSKHCFHHYTKVYGKQSNKSLEMHILIFNYNKKIVFSSMPNYLLRARRKPILMYFLPGGL